MSDTAIDLKDVSIKFRLAKEKITSLKTFLIKKMGGSLQYEEFYALKNVSFAIEKGDVLGIIGLNGAGKSTLLKIISGVLRPDRGTVKTVGQIAPLIELGAGFDKDLSGRENIFLNGLILGYPRHLIAEKYDEIVAFSELEKFIDTPVKNYSSGMKARLGFSIATIVSPEILIVDEVLSVGDHKFRKKSEEKIMSMISGGATVIFVSHSMQQIRKICNKVIWLSEGEIKEFGDKDLVVSRYESED